MNPTDCLEIVKIVGDTEKCRQIFELIEKNYGSNVEKITQQNVKEYIHLSKQQYEQF